MFEIQCLDSNGNTIDYFTQWDVDQKITIPISGYEDCLSGEINQHVHFCNSKSEKALVVRATVIDDSTISAEVPNILLQEPYPLIVYIYLTDSEDVSSQKTILHNEIPIRKRVKPDDYNYVENIERITAEMIKEEIEADTKQTRTDAINAINTTKAEAIGEVTVAKNAVIQLKTDTQTIHDNTQGIYDQMVQERESIVSDIKNDVVATMVEQGMELQMSDDGNGNVTMSVIMSEA